MAERDRWIDRCHAAERVVAQRDEQLLRERQSAAEERQRWIDRCLSAEQAVARRDEQLLREQQSAAEERQRWTDRCLAAESALLRNQRLLRGHAEEAARIRKSLSERDAEAARLAQELRAVRGSATWRWSQAVLESQPVRLFFGGMIRSIAERSRMTGAAGLRQAEPVSLAKRESPDPAVSDLQGRADRMISDHGFQGVPRETFAQAGREQLIALLAEGLRPESKILEFGCGCLRIAYWLVRFLDPGGYCGIEPARHRVGHGLRYLFTAEELRIKQPRFDYNTAFNSSVFGRKFDFFLARSIWTHASKLQIEATLDSFLRDAEPHAIFLASYLPAHSPEEDYPGTQWVGTSHESDTPGVIRHSIEWITGQCRNRSLNCEEIDGTDCDGQEWLRIRRIH
jgi:hypothetical protein